jgi:hypothetical protein
VFKCHRRQSVAGSDPSYTHRHEYQTSRRGLKAVSHQSKDCPFALVRSTSSQIQP